LREHLSRESRATTQKRIKQLEAVAKYARRLLEGLKAVDKLGRTAIEAQMLCVEGRSLETVSRSEWADLTIRVNEELSFLARACPQLGDRFMRTDQNQTRNVVL
jgi:hypothetical protein